MRKFSESGHPDSMPSLRERVKSENGLLRVVPLFTLARRSDFEQKNFSNAREKKIKVRHMANANDAQQLFENQNRLTNRTDRQPDRQTELSKNRTVRQTELIDKQN
jgi:hypothetical protein